MGRMTASPPPVPVVDPVIDPSPVEDVTGDVPWQAIVWNDPVNLMSYVTYVLQKLFGYPEPKATALMLDHSFLALGLSNVFLRVYAYNLAGIRTYEKAGFRTMGVRRKSKLMGGALWDTVYMEALADEFESPVLGQILIADQRR